MSTVPPWYMYSPAVPKPIYESPEAQAYWDIPVVAVSEQVRQNRVHARFYRLREEESSGGRNELPMDGEQRKETRREDHQVWPPPLGTQAAAPRKKKEETHLFWKKISNYRLSTFVTEKKYKTLVRIITL